METKRKIKSGLLLTFFYLLLCAAAVYADEGNLAETFEKNYVRQKYDSESGLNGSTANCVFSDSSGLLWVGSYSGLYRFDGSEFRQYSMEEFTVAVRCITQDTEGNLWIGTNGYGIYRYDGEYFQSLPIDQEKPLMRTVNSLLVDEDGILWAASNGGILKADLNEKIRKLYLAENVEEDNFRDMARLQDGTLVFVNRKGSALWMKNGTAACIEVTGLDEGEKVRCIEDGQGIGCYMLLGTDRDKILAVNEEGEVTHIYQNGEISSINDLMLMEDGGYWVCSDNGTALLNNREIRMVKLGINNSVEMACSDYQGNYWFASSRDGLLHIYENYFTNLGAYLGVEISVNSIAIYEDCLYIGTDEGIYCFHDGNPVTSALTNFCKGMRVRQLLADQAGNLWVATTRNGLLQQAPDGRIRIYSAYDNPLISNDLRCILVRDDGQIIMGSENGVSTLGEDGKITFLTGEEESLLANERILCMEETGDGKLYIGTDGDGLYIVEQGSILNHLTMEDGLSSNVILKLHESDKPGGVWSVSGAGIDLVNEKGQKGRITGLPMANSMDLMLLPEGEAVILASNGFFRLKEADLLLDQPEFSFYSREKGFPIDAAANAYNLIEGDTLYLCGTDGLCSLDLSRTPPKRPIQVYINSIQADGQELPVSSGKRELSANAYRLNIDIRLLNYCSDDYWVSYFLEGMDQEKTLAPAENVGAVSYTNLSGGYYRYQYQVLDNFNGEVVASEVLSLTKARKFWEDRNNLLILGVLLLGIMGEIAYFIMMLREKRLEYKIAEKINREKQREIERTAYLDLVTGVYNRNLYELDKQKYPASKLTALVTISVNHVEYLRKKYGIMHMEDVLRALVVLIRENMGEDVRIYRVSDFVFLFPCYKKADLESFTVKIKEDFRRMYAKEDEEAYSIAVGAVYQDRYMEESYQDLFKRCDSMRMLDQKHEETRFIRNKIVVLESLSGTNWQKSTDK